MKEGSLNKKSKPRLMVLALVLLSLLVFVNIFQNEFVGYDDQNLIENNESIRSLSPGNLAQMFTPKSRGNYQPVRVLSYAIDHALWGLRPFGFHLTNALLHALSVLGAFFLLQLLLPQKTAFISALLFAVLPIHVESVAWMSSRKDVLSLSFSLFAILFYERSYAEKNTKFYVVSLLAAAISLLSKLTAVTIPLCILLLEICRDGWPSFSEWKRKAIWLSPHVLLVCLVIVLNFIQFQPTTSHGDALAGLEQVGRPVVRDIWLSMPQVIWRYIGLTVFPYHLSTHYEVTRITNIADVRFLVPLLLLIGTMAAAVAAFVRGKRAIAFCIGWFFITFLPTSNIVPTAALLVDRYMHAPSIGIAALLGIALAYSFTIAAEKSMRLRRLAMVPAVSLILIFSILTVRRNADWRTTFSLFSRTLAVNPRSVEAHLALGAIYEKDGALDPAIDMYNSALAVVPDNYRVLYNLGVAYMKKGWHAHAVRALESSRAANPDFIATRFNLALAYQQQRRIDEAIAEHKAILKLDPHFAPAHGALGRIYLEKADYDSAMQELNLALQNQPDLAPALIDRAELLTRQGHYDRAGEDLQKLSSLGVDTQRLRAQLQRIQADAGSPGRPPQNPVN